MIIDLTDYENKALEIEIKKLEKAIFEAKAIICNIEFDILRHELRLIDQGITEEDVEKHIINFMENSDNPEGDLMELQKELNDWIENKSEEVITDLDKILHYSTILIMINRLRIRDYQEEIQVLNKQLLELKHERIELQKKKVEYLDGKRKYRELLKDE